MIIKFRTKMIHLNKKIDMLFISNQIYYKKNIIKTSFKIILIKKIKMNFKTIINNLSNNKKI